MKTYTHAYIIGKNNTIQIHMITILKKLTRYKVYPRLVRNQLILTNVWVTELSSSVENMV